MLVVINFSCPKSARLCSWLYDLFHNYPFTYDRSAITDLKCICSFTYKPAQRNIIGSTSFQMLYNTTVQPLAKRIVNYLQVGQKVKQTEEMGFIKFGSRVDLLLPIGTRVNVELNQAVQGGVTVIATL